MIGNWKRILAGLVATLLIGRLLGYFTPIIELPTLEASGSGLGFGDDFIPWMIKHALVASVLWIIVFAVGGFIAQRKFLVPALVFVVAQFAYGFWQGLTLGFGSENANGSDAAFLGIIESLQGMGTYGLWADIALLALPLFVIPTAAIAVGSIIGMKLFELQHSRSVAE